LTAATAKENARIEKLLTAFAEKGEKAAPTWMQPVLKAVPGVIMKILALLHKLAPLFKKLKEAHAWSEKNLPLDLVVGLWGLTLCFFGGTFPLVIAAYEAFKISGWDTSRAALNDLYGQLEDYRRASAIDDTRDDDGDGISDVDQISTTELVTRKASLALKVCDPNKVNDALGGLSQGFVGVIATLKFKYARTVALGVSIGNQLRKPAGMYLTPHLAALVPDEHRKWVPLFIDMVCKTIAVSIAWTIQAIISTVQCSIRGGLMFSRAMLRYANDKEYVKIDEDDTYLDEIAGWGVAFLGASFQLWNGFGLPFPLNILLIPFRALEAYLRWVVTSN
jgi:hypothetical protein